MWHTHAFDLCGLGNSVLNTARKGSNQVYGQPSPPKMQSWLMVGSGPEWFGCPLLSGLSEFGGMYLKHGWTGRL